MRTKLGRHLGSLSVLGVTFSLLGCFDGSPSASLTAASPQETTKSTAILEPEDEVKTTDQESPSAEPVPAKLAEIVKLLDANVADEVLLAYIHRDEHDYALSADEVIFLRRRGMNDGVIAALVRTPPPSRPAMEEPLPATASVSIDPAPAVVPALANPAPATSTPYPDPSTVTTQYVAVAEAAEPATVQYFNTYLAPHGSWVTLSDYGTCWRPTIVVADPTWKPYCNGGRWVWSDSGWYWQSDYSWGWATFHYGRWCNDRRAGWVWVPGNVWGPAWVSWRNSPDYCGWAPLPPAARYTTGIGLTYRGRRVGVDFNFGLTSDCYSFVESKRLDDHAWHRYRLGPRETGIVFAKTKPINRYDQGPGGVVHKGIADEWFGQDGGRRKRIPVKLDDVPSNGGVRPDDWRDHGRSLAVLRPRDVGRPRPVGADTPNHDLPSPRNPASGSRGETPQLLVNTPVADGATFRQRSTPGWWQNNDQPSAGPARGPVASVSDEPSNPALANPQVSDRPGRSLPELAADPRGRRGFGRDGRSDREQPQVPVQPPVETGPARPNVPRAERPSQRPGMEPRTTESSRTVIASRPVTEPPRIPPSSPSISPRNPGFTVAPGPAPAGSFGRPAPQAATPQPSPRFNPPTAPVVTRPAPSPAPAPVQNPRPTPSPAVVHPRFERPSPQPIAPSTHPRFQTPSAPAPSPSTHPRFQSPARPTQDQDKPGRSR